MIKSLVLSLEIIKKKNYKQFYIRCKNYLKLNYYLYQLYFYGNILSYKLLF